MSRSIRLALAACLTLAASNFAHSQDIQNNPPPAGDDVTALKAENAALKKEVADAKTTIAELQSQLAQAGISHQTSSPGATAQITDTAAGETSTNTTSAIPPKALPLDATNVTGTPAAPGASAAEPGASKTYTVVKGDSLWKIAHKMYPGDTKNGVDKLQEANKDSIGGKPLKIGQVLIVPQ